MCSKYFMENHQTKNAMSPKQIKNSLAKIELKSTQWEKKTLMYNVSSKFTYFVFNFDINREMVLVFELLLHHLWKSMAENILFECVPILHHSLHLNVYTLDTVLWWWCACITPSFIITRDVLFYFFFDRMWALSTSWLMVCGIHSNEEIVDRMNVCHAESHIYCMMLTAWYHHPKRTSWLCSTLPRHTNKWRHPKIAQKDNNRLFALIEMEFKF